MPKPVLLSFIPPVTIGGVSSPVVANLFDASGNFRQRQGSIKRPRVEAGGDGSRDMMYDLSRDAAPPRPPWPTEIGHRQDPGADGEGQ